MDGDSWRRSSSTAPMTFTEADIDAAEQKSSGEFQKVPEIVGQFLSQMHQAFLDRNVVELHNLYERDFTTLSERYFRLVPWPAADAIAHYVQNDANFIFLYNELYYRHLFSKMSPSLAQRLDSWTNYSNLFNLFLSDRMVDYDLPPSWLWDMVDEFIYQFESWCQFRSKVKNKTQEEIAYLRENEDIWGVHPVLRILHYLVIKSNIISWLANGGPVGSDDPDNDQFDISSLPVYRFIGYFSIVGLLRVNTLLGDYRLALMVLQPLEFNGQTALFTHVTACHVSLYYYMGFCYVMLRRYEDAARVFSATVLHIGRIKHNHTRSYQYEQINKRIDQMTALLSLCIVFKPQHVDESMMVTIREKAGDRLSRLRQGETQAFEELFSYASPKFVNPAPPDYDSTTDTNMEAAKLQARLFMEEVKSQLLLPDIRSYLKLYTTIEIDKLATLMDVDERTARGRLHALKHKSWTYKGSFDTPPFDGDYTSSSDIGFHVEKNIVHITDVKQAARHGEYFIENIAKLDDMLDILRQQSSDSFKQKSRGAQVRIHRGA